MATELVLHLINVAAFRDHPAPLLGLKRTAGSLFTRSAVVARQQQNASGESEGPGGFTVVLPHSPKPVHTLYRGACRNTEGGGSNFTGNVDRFKH